MHAMCADVLHLFLTLLFRDFPARPGDNRDLWPHDRGVWAPLSDLNCHEVVARKSLVWQCIVFLNAFFFFKKLSSDTDFPNLISLFSHDKSKVHNLNDHSTEAICTVCTQNYIAIRDLNCAIWMTVRTIIWNVQLYSNYTLRCNFAYTWSKILSVEWSFKLRNSNDNSNCALCSRVKTVFKNTPLDRVTQRDEYLMILKQ